MVAAVLGAALVAVLVVGHWGTVRDHVEAWHFKLTGGTKLKANSVTEIVVSKIGGYYRRGITKEADIARIVDWFNTLNIEHSDEGFRDAIRGTKTAQIGTVAFHLANGEQKVLTLWQRHVTWDTRHYENAVGRRGGRWYFDDLKVILNESLGPP